MGIRLTSLAVALAMALPLAGCNGLASKPKGPPDNVLNPGPLGDHVMGKATAPVTVIEYASLSCPHCHNFEVKVFPKFKRAFINTGKVRYVVREFPIGHASGTAAIINHCAPKGKFFTLFHAYLTHQPEWVSQDVRLNAIYAVAHHAVGMSRATFDKCLANQPMIAALRQVKDRGRKLGVEGTPTFFIKGQRIQGEVTFAQIKTLIEAKPVAKAKAKGSQSGSA